MVTNVPKRVSWDAPLHHAWHFLRICGKDVMTRQWSRILQSRIWKNSETGHFITLTEYSEMFYETWLSSFFSILCALALARGVFVLDDEHA
jgi:hypothetical protein